jgi:RNase P/RNase MRP subunit p29
MSEIMLYTDLIGKKVHVVLYKYKQVLEYDGTIEAVTGIMFKLKQENGESIWLHKLRKRDCMTFNENDWIMEEKQ